MKPWYAFAASFLLACPALVAAQTGGGWFTMKPKAAEPAEGVFRCASAPALLLGRSAMKTAPGVADRLQARLKGLPGAAPAQEARGRLPQTPCIVVGLTRDHAALRGLVERARAKLPPEGLGEEGFVLDVKPERVLIAAAKPAGALYGTLAFLGMAGAEDGALVVPAGLTVDWPTMRWRGMHIMVGGRESLPAVERIITDYLPALRMNRVIVEIDYAFRYRSHPEVGQPNGLTVEDCRRLSDLAGRNSVKLIPMINCLGHQSWAKDTAKLLTSHPELDETPDLPPDNPGIYCRSWCPSNPDCYRIVDDLFDELIDAFGADTVHVGMDEVFILGKCPRCKGQDNAELFSKAVKGLHDHLTGKRHARMLMWGDRLLDGRATGYGEWEASTNGTAPAIDRVPKDIVMCDWHYGTPQDFPSVRHFQEKGFAVWPSGWNSDANVRLLAGCALKNAGPRMLGYMATTWVAADEVVRLLGMRADGAGLKSEQAGLVAGIRRGSHMSWEGGDTR